MDSAHPHIKLGEVDSTPSEIFREQIGSRLTSYMEACPATQVILIPSVRDMISRHVAFPQAMFEKDRLTELGLPKVSCLSMPCCCGKALTVLDFGRATESQTTT